MSRPESRSRVREPQQERSRRTRENVLEAAVACFEESGYDGTTTAAIARRAGIAVGTLYGYFRDKRAILLELIEATTAEIADHVVKGLDPEAWHDSDPRENTRALIDAIFHTRSFNPGMQRIVWERFFKDPEVRTVMEGIEQRVQGALAELLASLKSSGALRVDDVETAAILIHLSVEWTSNRLVLGEDEGRIDAAVHACSDMISRFLFRD
ncbi:MAG: TetR/AcrR family transcriptional regulator [Myxococcales bacterium]|nr:TetR/AcrR family transcriptional regulator [Myxococcales bacterium]